MLIMSQATQSSILPNSDIDSHKKVVKEIKRCFIGLQKQNDSGKADHAHQDQNGVPVDTGRKLNVNKAFRRRPGRLLNVLCTFNLRPVSTGVAHAVTGVTGVLQNSSYNILMQTASFTVRNPKVYNYLFEISSQLSYISPELLPSDFKGISICVFGKTSITAHLPKV